MLTALIPLQGVVAVSVIVQERVEATPFTISVTARDLPAPGAVNNLKYISPVVHDIGIIVLTVVSVVFVALLPVAAI